MKSRGILLAMGLGVTLLVVIINYIYLQHKSRNTFVELQALIEQEHHLNTEWGRLQIEHSTLVNNSRIETKAGKELGMKLPENQQILNIKR